MTVHVMPAQTMFRLAVLQISALTAAVGHSDESVLLQTKPVVVEHTYTQVSGDPHVWNLNRNRELFDLTMDDMSEVHHPLSQKDFDHSELNSGLRLALEKKISALSTDQKPTLFFIGDSLMRQIATVACALVQKSRRVTRAFMKWTMLDTQCKGEFGNVVFAWSQDLTPSLVAHLKKKYAAPDFVIWEASAFWLGPWNEANRTRYTQLAKQTMQAYANDAPNATLKVFLSHKPCTNLKWEVPTADDIKQYNNIHVTIAKNEKIDVKIADGYKFTEDLGCKATKDGRHWDLHVFSELMMALDA